MKNKPIAGFHKKKRRLIYMMAPSYSGSTLLTSLLSTHRAITTIGELKATSMGDIEQYLCSCGQPLLECQFWRTVKEAMDRCGNKFVLSHFGTHFITDNRLCNRLLRSGVRGKLFEAARSIALGIVPSWRRILQEILNTNRTLIDILCDLHEGYVFLDDSKDAVRLRYLLSGGYWDIRVINLVRDGRGVTNSYMGHYKVSMEEAVKEWLHTCREIAHMESRLGKNQCLRVNYEELCCNPQTVLTKIYNFIGVEQSVCSANYHASDYHILGNAMRLTSTSTIRLDEKWRTKLSAVDLEIFESRAGRINRKLGYQ